VIYIPAGKALVAIEAVFPTPKVCNDCALHPGEGCCTGHDCLARFRDDGKDVIFRLVDWPGEIVKNNSSKPLRWIIDSYVANDCTGEVAYFVECPKCVTDYGYAPESGSGDFFERHKYCPSCGVRLLPGEGT